MGVCERVERLERRVLMHAGQIDTGFGDGGRIGVDYDSGNDRLADIIQIGSGKLMTISFNDGGFVQLTRLNSSGSIDNTFSSDGRIVTSHLWGSDTLTRPGRTSFHSASGRFAVAFDSPGTSWFDVGIFNSNGSLYTTFGGDGILQGSTAFQPQRIAFQQSNGKLVVAGRAPDLDSVRPPILVRRYNTDGTQDMTFGEANGETRLEMTELMNDMVVMSDGRIVLTGEFSDVGTPDDPFDLNYGQELVRLTSGGDFDDSFDEDGQLLFNNVFDGPSAHTPHGRDLAAASDGSIYVLSDTGGGVALSHFTSAGDVDLLMDTSLARPAAAVLPPVRIAIDNAGNVLAMGPISTTTGQPHNAYVVRYFSDGGLDTQYGGKGVTVTGVEDATALVVAGDAAIVGGRGNAGIGTQRDLLITKLQGGDAAEPDVVLNRRGSLILNANNNDENIEMYIRSRDGRLILRVNDFARSFAPSKVKRIALFALGGDDRVTIHPGVKGAYADAGGGADTMNGGQGGDIFIGGPGKDRIFGNDGDDTLLGSGSNDYLLGGAGKDDLFGDAGNDTLSGAGGNDRLFSGLGADFVVGGNGIDAAPEDDEDTVSTVERIIL